MHGSELLVPLLARNTNYCKQGVRESIVRNGHMNKYDGETFEEEDAKQFIISFVEHFCRFYNGGKSSGDVCTGLTSSARSFLSEQTQLLGKHATSCAVLTDYINYVASCCGMDFGLYSSDIGN